MYNVGLLSKDFDLIEQFKKIDYFDSFKIGNDISELNDTDILIISDRVFSANDLLGKIAQEKFNVKHVYFMVSNKNYSNNLRNLLESKNIIVIPPRLTNNQIIEFIIKNSFDGIRTDKNIFTFLGADSKVGTTMVAQSIAELISLQTNKSVFLGFLNGKTSTEYIENSRGQGIDEIKTKLTNKILSFDEFIDVCIKKDNLYILEGASYLPEIKYYHPEDIENLINLISNKFDIIILDTGSNVELGMTIGALNLTSFRFLITTQQESALQNFNKVNEQVLKKLGIKDFMLIINKYIDDNMLGSAYEIAKLYNNTLAATVPYLKWGWQAEKDKKTFLNYDDKEYRFKIEEIAAIIYKSLGLENLTIEKTGLPWYKKIFSNNKA